MSKKIHLLLTINCLLITVHCSSLSAQNLVPNPSFEDTVVCPNGFNQLNKALGWSININTGDYFNKCSLISDVHVPNNTMGFQYPPDNNCGAYCGIIAYVELNPGSEEIVGRGLLSPLIIGQKYYASFKVNLADGNAINCGINKLGIKFTNTFYGETITIPSPLVNNFAHIYTNNVITDTSNWTTVTGSFVADSSYNYILIGRFFDNNNTTKICQNSNSKWSYYFIDDICVSTDSATCNPYSFICDVGITSYQKSNIEIYPNPASDEITIDIAESYKNSKVIFYNILGKKIKEYVIQPMANKINISNFYSGGYFVQINFNNKIINQKFIKNN